MAGRAFLDTNIALRLLNTQLSEHDAVYRLVENLRQQSVELWISRQILREYLVQVTRSGFIAVPFTKRQTVEHATTLRSLFKVADETDAVTDKLLELIQEFPTGGKQIHDANIVATMLVYGIDTLLTINVEDMKRFNTKIKILSPTT